MANRTRNFNPGPAALPLEALERAREELLDFQGTGMSVMEHSHRGAVYEKVHYEAMSLLRELLGVSDDYHVLFLQGGGRHQFAMVPMNFLHPGRSADYLLTGTWSKDALSEAKLLGQARVAGTGEVGGTYTRVPTQSDLDLDPKAAYVHLTSNNTLFGTQFHTLPKTGSVPIVADLTSDLLCRPLDVSRYGLIYAAAQKNVGPAGVTVVIARKDLVEGSRKDIPKVFRYATHADKDSLFNTPPTFAIYMMRNTLDVMKARGGAAAMETASRARAELVYDLVDERPDFFKSPVEKASRSLMNVVFRLPSEALEAQLIETAKKNGMVGIKGHRSVGGIRVSLYDWVELEWVTDLVALMRDFASQHG